MKKTKLGILALLSLALPLASCSEKGSESVKPSPSEPETGESAKPSTGSDLHQDESIELMMFGDLYKDQIRSIYAKLIGVSGEITWTSSDESIVAIGSNPLNGNMPEVALLANDYGTAIIKASLKEDPSVYTEYAVTVSDQFLEMDETLFDTVSSSLKMETKEEYLSYNEDYQETVDDYDTITTIFEENADQSNGLNDNLTDAYEIKVTDSKGKETFHKEYVRDGRFLASEYLDFTNTVRKKRLSSDDESMYWEASPYFNYLGKSDDVKASDFVSFDGGNTYHFIGGYTIAEQIALNFFQEDISPDDFYFTVENGMVSSMTMVVEPTIGNTNDKEDIVEKYGARFTSTLSEIQEAKINHLLPYEHESYQDGITSALSKMKNLKNYKATATRKTSGSADEVYTYTYTEDTIDIVRTVGSQTLSHTGVHKRADGSYYEYEVNTDGSLLITKDHNTPFDGSDADGNKINRYPTFAFAPEIFAKTDEENVFVSRGNNGQFITYCSYLPQTWTLLHYFEEDGTLALSSDGYLKNVKTTMTDLETQYEVSVSYSDFLQAKVDVDFSKAEAPANPTSFEEESATLAKEMKEWNFYDAVPYLYFKGGFSTSVEMERGDDGEVSCAYLRTNRLDEADNDYVDNYITSYQELLVSKGYLKTEEKDKQGYVIYKKGEYKISIGREMNWNSTYAYPSCIIRVFSDKLNVQ